ncbi:hypothetical protein Q8A73_021865 [Channa argus]|nr:hypothetical protein Q8A73_021865 [Channa argus]
MSRCLLATVNVFPHQGLARLVLLSVLSAVLGEACPLYVHSVSDPLPYCLTVTTASPVENERGKRSEHLKLSASSAIIEDAPAFKTVRQNDLCCTDSASVNPAAIHPPPPSSSCPLTIQTSQFLPIEVTRRAAHCYLVAPGRLYSESWRSALDFLVRDHGHFLLHCGRDSSRGDVTEQEPSIWEPGEPLVMSASRKDPLENNLTCPKHRPTWASPCSPPLDSHNE